MEIWKDVKGYEGLYQVSSEGRVRSLDRTVLRALPGKAARVCSQKGRIINPQVNKGTRKGSKPRAELKLSKEGKVTGFQVHRLVAMAFLSDDVTLEVNHKNGDPMDNRVENLEMATRAENIKHAFDNGLIGTSYRVERIDTISGDVVEFRSVSEAARTIPISQGSLRFHLEKRTDAEYKGYKWRYK